MIRTCTQRLFVNGTLALLLLLGCDVASAPSLGTEEQGANVRAADSLLVGKNLDRALKAVLSPLTPPVRLLSIVVLPSQLVLQVQNSTDRSQVQEFRYRNGKVEGPTPVKLLGKGNLKDNLFNLEAADPHVAKQVLSAVQAEYRDPVRKLVMIRNLPASLDIQFRTYLSAKHGDLVIAADKQGKLLGPITPPVTN
jgi:hypothetical protein